MQRVNLVCTPISLIKARLHRWYPSLIYRIGSSESHSARCVSLPVEEESDAHALGHIPTGQSATKRAPILTHPCHQCTIHFKNFESPSLSLSLFFARIHSFHFQLEIILIWCMANATKRVRRYPLNSFLVPFPSSFQRFSPLPTPRTRQPVTRSTGICAVGYYALPRFNLYPLGGISWKRTEVE